MAAVESELARVSISESVFSRNSIRSEEDDEEALKWAAIEKLPTYNRIRTAILDGNVHQFDVEILGYDVKRNLIQKLVPTEEENEQFINKLRARIDRVAIELPKIEVRFEKLNVEAKVHVGKRALPTLYNFVVNMIDQYLSRFNLSPTKKHTLKILQSVSGILKPSRMTLLLGPPGSGKTTLLLALAGKLDKSLKVSGHVTYNGYDFTEFVPERTSAYISQNDLHTAEMTVRETFDFASRCQGVGSRYEMITELSRREKQAKIKPDPDIDAFMKASALKGQETSIVTDYILKILGLDICADVIVGDHMRRGISGGQKKRVTTGEMLAFPPAMEFLKSPRNQSHPAALVTENYGLGNRDFFKALLSREILLMKRNSFVFVFKSFQILVLAFVAMTVFFRTNMHRRTVSDGTLYLGAIFFGIICMMFNGFSELSMTVARLPVFYKQRNQMLFPAWSWLLPIFFTRIPVSLFESALWIVMTYYETGFAPNPGRFFKSFLVLFLIGQMAAAMFRLIATLSRTIVIANTFGWFALLIVFVLGGFVLSKGDIPNWWIWGYWSSPMMYAQNALAVNEFTATRWQKVNNNGTSLGNQIMESRGLATGKNWYWIGAGALAGFIILFNVVSILALTYLRAPSSPQAVLAEEEEDAKRNPKHSFAQDRIPSGKKGMVLPFQPLAMSFNNVNYYVDMPTEMKRQGVSENKLQLLNEVSSLFRPGILTALVGVSGAGKTTLMDVLAGRKTGGYIEGDIRISGYPKKQETFARISGYCEQTDIHSPYVTVYESLVFSAWLRLSHDVDKQTKKMFVEEIMELVELLPLRDALVGMPGVNGLSTEQRKRLTIAVELVANPSIIFMDEPTSGLDARAAAIVMRTVRNTVDTGRTVVCTIHQPSIDIFEAFDELLLMKRGGRVIYAGPLGTNSQALIDYLQAVPGVPSIKDGYNPATWMLEVTAVDMEARLGIDFAEIYKSSTLYKENEALIVQWSTPQDESKDLSFPTQYPVSFSGQVIACLWKQQCSYWKNPYYVVVRMFYTIITALMLGTMFWNAGSNRDTQKGVFNIMGCIFVAVIFIGISNAFAVQPVVAIERTVYYREKAAGMYSALPYAFGQVLIEMPYVLLQTITYGVIVYSMMGLEWTAAKFFWFIFFTYFTYLYFTLYGMMAVAVTPNEQIAAILSQSFYALWNLFSGFLIPRPRIPIWWRWYYWATPFAWSMYGVITSQLGDVGTHITLNEGNGTTVEEYLTEYFGYHHSWLGAVAGVHVGLVVLFAFVFAFCVRTFNFQTR